jgi:phosphoribosylformylglycinamidine cyclo-ligase
MPGMYASGEYDLAGFTVGAVERDGLIDGSRIMDGDVVLGLASSGAHSNGYSLIRKVIEHAGANLDDAFHGSTLGEALLAPTRIYVSSILPLLKRCRINGMAHITGGGLTENIIRVVPEGLALSIDSSSWTPPPVFDWLQRAGNIAPDEMRRTFNMGIGFVLITSPEQAEQVTAALDEPVAQIGRIVAHDGGERVRFE